MPLYVGSVQPWQRRGAKRSAARVTLAEASWHSDPAEVDDNPHFLL